MEKTDKAISQVPPVRMLKDPETVLGRFIYIIAFIIRKDYDLALSEATSFNKILAKFETTPDLEIMSALVKLLSQYALVAKSGREEDMKAYERIKKKALFKKILNHDEIIYKRIAEWLNDRTMH